MRFIKRDHLYEYALNAVCGEQFDCFFSFVRWEGHWWSAHRRDSMFDPEEWATASEKKPSEVVVVKWRHDGDDLVVDHEHVVGFGNDPRIAMVGGRPIVLFRAAYNQEHEMLLYDISANVLQPVIIGDPWFKYGKNWMPFDDGGQLGAVHGFNPVRILCINLQDGRGEIVRDLPTTFTPRSAHDRFAMLRGGSNVLSHDGILFGLGHATIATYNHVPFSWVLNEKGKMSISIQSDFDELFEAGYNIVDPTSLAEGDDGRYYVGLCCSERDWFFDQKFLNILSPISVNFESHALSVDLETYAREPKVRMHTADLLNCNIPNTTALYAARRVEAVGFPIFGPFEKIESGRYVFCFRYRSEASQVIQCGWIDATICLPGMPTSVGQHPIFGTEGKISTASFECDFPIQPHAAYEVRLFSNGVSAMTVYDVRLIKLREIEGRPTTRAHCYAKSEVEDR
jgi:hypothetical protein